jgi:hypothetical protein
LNTTPGGLAFGRDMVLDIPPLIADLQLIREQRQHLIDNHLIAANRRRFSYDYTVGDEVLKLKYKPDKLELELQVHFEWNKFTLKWHSYHSFSIT